MSIEGKTVGKKKGQQNYRFVTYKEKKLNICSKFKT